MGYMAGEMLWKGFMRNPSDSGYGTWEKAPTINSSGVMTIDYRTSSPSKIVSCLYYFKNKVDLTNYSTLQLIGSTQDQNSIWKGFPRMAVVKDIASPHVVAADVGGSNMTNLSLDVSELTGEYYIGFDMMSQGNGTVGSIVTMKELYLE